MALQLFDAERREDAIRRPARPVFADDVEIASVGGQHHTARKQPERYGAHQIVRPEACCECTPKTEDSQLVGSVVRQKHELAIAREGNLERLPSRTSEHTVQLQSRGRSAIFVDAEDGRPGCDSDDEMVVVGWG